MRARDMIAAERLRQIEQEGWTRDHDRSHPIGELYRAGLAYLLEDERHWPWQSSGWNPKDRKANLVRAGALMVAERDRDKDDDEGTVRWTYAQVIPTLLAGIEAELDELLRDEQGSDVWRVHRPNEDRTLCIDCGLRWPCPEWKSGWDEYTCGMPVVRLVYDEATDDHEAIPALCGEPVLVHRDSAEALHVGGLVGMDPTTSWKLECLGGHVLLVPDHEGDGHEIPFDMDVAVNALRQLVVGTVIVERPQP